MDAVKSMDHSRQIVAATSVFTGALLLGLLITFSGENASKYSQFFRSQGSSSSSSSSQPNIIFILADDLGWNSIGGLGNDVTSDIAFTTPILTNMAQNGIVIANYYAQELCTPSRASLLTGRYPISLGMQYGSILAVKPWGLSLEETTIAEVLSDAGYQTAMLGKWHLGHHSAANLPTARGFDSFVGYLDGENYYFSKRDPQYTTYYDFMRSDKECYYTYNEDSLSTYSTNLYRDEAVDIINSHDSSAGPLFMYLAFQAVHDPYEDISGSKTVSEEYVSDSVYKKVMSDVKGYKRKLHAMTLAVLDSAVGDIVTALKDTGLLSNTHIIFASDNGGCYLGGGKNGPLRGTKATLLEGGTRVDAFVYSAILEEKGATGRSISDLFHVSDWFPTILDLAGVTYSASEARPLDGISHYGSLAFSEGVVSPFPTRTSMLYNSFYNVAGKSYNIWTNGTFAVRNERYKLIHFYNSSTYAQWYESSDILAEDDEMEVKQCQTGNAMKNSEFVYALYDLESDPYETNNLYLDTSEEIVEAKESLYELLAEYNRKASIDTSEEVQESDTCRSKWEENSGYIIPFVETTDSSVSSVLRDSATYPAYCGHSADASD